MPSHYPSWGSGTQLDRDLTHYSIVKLITPHGDRELALKPCSKRRANAHYPSWGSGTYVSGSPVALSSVSLPLMGIGNEVSNSETFDEETSLPLMGIGNLKASIMAHGLLQLITPHGDREHAVILVRLDLDLLITPHGDRELHLPRQRR